MLTTCTRFLLCVIIVIISSISTIQAQPTVYLVRHAEKLAEWPFGGNLGRLHPLSVKGVETAERIKAYFDSGSFAAIFSSPTTRTLHTALPLAQKLGLSVEVADACADTAAIDAFYAELSSRFKSDQTVLLVSHSNIIPYLLIKAGLPENCRNEMGFTTSTRHSWLLIEGYEHIWRIDKLNFKKKNCKSFSKIKF